MQSNTYYALYARKVYNHLYKWQHFSLAAFELHELQISITVMFIASDLDWE
jgi:hypothetical protein